MEHLLTLDGNLTANVCIVESITAAPNRLILRKNRNGEISIMVTGADDCPARGVTVTATINGKDNRLVTVSPDSQETDDDGQAVFTIQTKDKKGAAVITFKASDLDKVATVQVKVR